MAVVKTRLGRECKAYVSTTTHENGGAITWSEVDLVQSIDHEDSKTEAARNDRKSQITKFGEGQRGIAYTLNCTYESDDAVIELLRDAYDNNTTLALAIMDGDITTSGETGAYLDVQVFDGPKPEELEEFVGVAFKLRPSAKSDYEPQRVTIA